MSKIVVHLIPTSDDSNVLFECLSTDRWTRLPEDDDAFGAPPVYFEDRADGTIVGWVYEDGFSVIEVYGPRAREIAEWLRGQISVFEIETLIEDEKQRPASLTRSAALTRLAMAAAPEGDPRVISILEARLADADDTMRSAAAGACYYHRRPEVKAALEKARDEERVSYVRDDIEDVLARWDDVPY